MANFPEGGEVQTDAGKTQFVERRAVALLNLVNHGASAQASESEVAVFLKPAGGNVKKILLRIRNVAQDEVEEAPAQDDLGLGAMPGAGGAKEIMDLAMRLLKLRPSAKDNQPLEMVLCWLGDAADDRPSVESSRHRRGWRGVPAAAAGRPGAGRHAAAP